MCGDTAPRLVYSSRTAAVQAVVYMQIFVVSGQHLRVPSTGISQVQDAAAVTEDNRQ